MTMLLHIRGHQQANLPQIVLAGGSTAACLGLSERGEQDCRKDADDGDNNEQLNQRKSVTNMLVHVT